MLKKHLAADFLQLFLFNHHPKHMKTAIKKILPDAIAIACFALIGLLYFLEPVREGLVLSGHDHTAAVGSSREMEHYRETHDGERTRWTNTLFGGMPTYQMSPSYPSTDLLGTISQVYRLGLPDVVAYVFIMLLGFYIMLRAFNFRVWMAALGAILWAFSSYYFIIIAAGHIWKLLALSYIPPTIGGMALCYRGRHLWGIVVTGLFTAMQILSNHVQMTYYFLFVIALMMVAYFIEALRAHKLRQWALSTASFAVGGIIGICINLSNLYHTWEYSKESMRGKSELTQKTKDPSDQTDSGLERSYITAWSYGIGETWTLLVPNTKGGASMVLSNNSTAMEKANPAYTPIYQAFTQYFGEQPGTSGPVYVGACVLTLFILGLFIVQGPMKWCLLIATVLSILLSWGKNFMPFTDFFLDYVPMYDKFRTVASILVIAEFTIPFLGLLALKKLVEDPDCLRGTDGRFPRIHYLTLSFALTGGIAFLFWLMPDTFFGNYLSTSDTVYMNQYVQAGYIPQDMSSGILANMSEMRRAMFTADAMRSFLVVAVGCAVLLVYRWKRIGTATMVGCLIVLCLCDMWGVNKRYLNNGMFSAPRNNEQSFPITQADQIILQDTDPYYRVLDLSVSTFNDNATSYHHKSIGGYHAAKLRRYQEVIEAHIQHEMNAAHKAVIETQGLLDQVNGDSLFPVLNMLNTKYLILPLKDGQKLPANNPHAYGNAWFVSEVQYVDNADAELASLNRVNLRRTAVVDNRFKETLGEAETLPVDSMSTIRLTGYEANRLTYEVNATTEGVAVFSDIYYPGWTCTIDGTEVPIARADYILRAVRIPAGKHTVEMNFDPQTIHITEAIAYAAIFTLALLLLVLLVWQLRKKK